MISLSTQAEFRPLRDLPFCYLCTGPFEENSPRRKRTRDHVPPSAVFLAEDREPALILPAHEACNTGQSAYDEQIAHLVRLLHGKPPPRGKLDVRVSTAYIGERVGGVSLDFKSIVWKWVRGFHAALYREALPEHTVRSVHPPMPGGVLVGTVVRSEDRFPQHVEFVKTLKKNRAVDRADRVLSRNGRCRYECVWSRLGGSSGPAWGCCFGLQVYDWIDLGDPRAIQRGCVGLYLRAKGPPPGAAVDTVLELPIPNREALDPFGP